VSWFNVLGYQLTWFVTVIGVSHGKAWTGIVTSALFCGSQLVWSRWRRLDLLLIAAALLLGALLDGALAMTGLVQYPGSSPAAPVSSAPAWILSLWAAFATTITRSLGWLRGRPWTAFVLGAVGGPLAYLGAARGWGVVRLAPPTWQPMLVLALGWAGALVLLVVLAKTGPGPDRDRGSLEELHFP
jgi:hypothetical protein